jgi:hypothetical protein
MLIAYIHSLPLQYAADSVCTFAAPASLEALTDAETTLGCQLPTDLTQLLRETDGLSNIVHGRFIWPIATLVNENRYVRTTMRSVLRAIPVESVLFFGDDGGGDMYFFFLPATTTATSAIYCWRHESDTYEYFAPTISVYLARMIAG